MPTLTAKRIAVLRDLIETRQRLAGAPRWLIRVEWWAERALRWGNSWFKRWALLRLVIAISVIVPVGWTIWTYTETLRDREQADRITALTLIHSNAPPDHPIVREALAFLMSRKISLRNVQWSFADLSGAILSGADFSGANLTGADLKAANLTDANLTGANLTDANLTGANLTRADLIRTNLTGADLANANLTNAKLVHADLTGAVLQGTNVTWQQLDSACVSSGGERPGLPNKLEPPRRVC